MHKYGNCEVHRNKENEYFDKLTNKAFCSLCAIDKAQERKGEGNVQIILIEEAYNNSIDRAQKESDDYALENKK